jgi:anti-sigma B factor antagonist
MISDLHARGGSRWLAMNLELAQGKHGAWARIELYERATNGLGPRRIALVGLRGWLDHGAADRLAHTLEDLGARGVDQVLLDCSELSHLDYREAPGLVEALERFEARVGGVVVCGLSRHLRDLFRVAGCEPRLRCWPSAVELLEATLSLEPSSECAS